MPIFHRKKGGFDPELEFKLPPLVKMLVLISEKRLSTEISKLHIKKDIFRIDIGLT